MPKTTIKPGEEIKVGYLTYIGSDGKIHCRPAEQPIAQMLLFPISATEFTSVSDGDPPVAYVDVDARSNTPVGYEIFDLKSKEVVGSISIHRYDASTNEYSFTVTPTQGDIGSCTFRGDTFAWDSSPMHATREGMALYEQIKAMPPIADLSLSDEQIRRIQIEMSKPEKLQLGKPLSETEESFVIPKSSELFPLVRWLYERFAALSAAGRPLPNLANTIANLEKILPLTDQPVWYEEDMSKVWGIVESSQSLQESARNYFAGSLPTGVQKLREHLSKALPPATCHLPPDSDEPIIK